MAYEPKTWENGNIIDADSLNHIEQGIAGAATAGAQGYSFWAATAAVADSKLTKAQLPNSGNGTNKMILLLMRMEMCITLQL